MSEHVEAEAAVLVSLPKDDPERVAAEAHAEGCASCRRALDESERLMRRLRGTEPRAHLHSPRMKPLLALIESELARERRTTLALSAVTGGGVAVSWIFQISLDYSTASTEAARVSVSLAVLVVAVVATVLSRLMRRIVLGLLVATSGLLALAAGRVAGLEPGIGAQCTLWEVVSAAIPWTAAALMGRRFPGTFSRGQMMAIAASGALASQAAQHLTCPVWHDDAHLLIFHFGGVLLAMGLGALGPGARPKAVIA